MIICEPGLGSPLPPILWLQRGNIDTVRRNRSLENKITNRILRFLSPEGEKFIFLVGGGGRKMSRPNERTGRYAVTGQAYRTKYVFRAYSRYISLHVKVLHVTFCQLLNCVMKMLHSTWLVYQINHTARLFSSSRSEKSANGGGGQLILCKFGPCIAIARKQITVSILYIKHHSKVKALDFSRGWGGRLGGGKRG